MMEAEAIIQRLYELGEFHNPKYMEGVTREDLPKFRLHDRPVINAIKSIQEMMIPNLEDFTEFHYGRREALIDGDVGPATDDLLEFPRCGFPDYPVPDGTLAMGRQEANWPTACRGKLTAGRNFASLPGSNREDTDGVWWASANNWTWALEDVAITVAEVNDSSADVYASLKRLSGSTLAWSYLAQNSCSVQLAQAYNTATNWGAKDFAATVKSHEDGHAWGLPHNNDRDALMYPSIHSRSVARHGYPNSTDLSVARGLGYKLSDKSGPPPRDKLYLPRPWDEPEEPDEPDDPEDPLQVRLRGTTTVYVGGEAVGDFIFTPKPGA